MRRLLDCCQGSYFRPSVLPQRKKEGRKLCQNLCSQGGHSLQEASELLHLRLQMLHVQRMHSILQEDLLPTMVKTEMHKC